MKRGMTLIIMLLAAAALFCSCKWKKPFETDAPMCGFEFSHSGMHTGLIYTLMAEKDDGGWHADLSLLCGEREYSLAMTENDVQELESIIETHHLTHWNDFDKVDPSALDGTSFDLIIRYEDGQKAAASGSNAFPEGYRAAHEAIVQFFGALMERNGIENPL